MTNETNAAARRTANRRRAYLHCSGLGVYSLSDDANPNSETGFTDLWRRYGVKFGDKPSCASEDRDEVLRFAEERNLEVVEQENS